MSNRHTVVRLSVSALLAIVGLSVSMLSYAQEEHAAAPAGEGTIVIEQRSSHDERMLGEWTLLKPGNEDLRSTQTDYTVEHATTGTYTLIVTPPKGMVTSIRTYHGSEQLEHLTRPQVTFKLADGETLRIVVSYTLMRSGIVSVQSDPPGLVFELTGPNGIKEVGVTPASFLGQPIGPYSVKYETPEGCATIAPKSDILKENSRVSFDVFLTCEYAQKLRERERTKADEFVVISVDGADVTLYDVPQDAWFSAFVFGAARRNVIGGYRDEAGNPNGQFGPGNNVTLAELAKIAHRLSGISEEAFIGVNPENAGALAQWFSPFIASAESRGWLVYQDTSIDPLRPATRAEVIATFLQALDVQAKWPKAQMFTDVTLRTRYAGAVETAAADGIVEGRTDERGKPLNLFAPNDPVNRAEIAKMIDNVFRIYMEKNED